jgi:phage-related tail fiber protein
MMHDFLSLHGIGIKEIIKSPTGSQSFLTPGNYVFTVPEGVNSLIVLLVGGGGAGGTGYSISNSSWPGAGGGGGGGFILQLDVESGMEFPIIVGSGGIASNSSDGGPGGFSEIIIDGVAYRGNGGGGGASNTGGTHFPSGGAGGSVVPPPNSWSLAGSRGGLNGGDVRLVPGSGQGGYSAVAALGRGNGNSGGGFSNTLRDGHSGGIMFIW